MPQTSSADFEKNHILPSSSSSTPARLLEPILSKTTVVVLSRGGRRRLPIRPSRTKAQSSTAIQRSTGYTFPRDSSAAPSPAHWATKGKDGYPFHSRYRYVGFSSRRQGLPGLVQPQSCLAAGRPALPSKRIDTGVRMPQEQDRHESSAPCRGSSCARQAA